VAWLEQTPGGLYHIAFRFDGQKLKKSLRTRDVQAANARLHRVDENIRLVESGRLVVPTDGDLGTFLLSDGQLNGTKSRRPKRRIRTLRDFAEAFLSAIPDGSLEETTIRGMETHVKHLCRVLGAAFSLSEVGLEDLQRYVDRRTKDKGIRGKRLSSATIKKEITTLRTIWNWAKNAGHVGRPLPLKGLRYPKMREKPPFQTLAEIERRIAQSMLSTEQENELWSALFLAADEIQELLEYVQATARHPFLYPMFVFAAHTGARRSEILRSQLDDIDFAAGIVTIREKKRVRGRLTTRSVPLSPLLRNVLRECRPLHEGGLFTFSLGLDVQHSKKTRAEVCPLTRDEAHDHFKRAVAGSKWSKARGWHVFRHSFCSNCAAARIDQRLINAWVGHQTEEMVRRYRHLIPDQQQRAIAEVFPADCH
jgi:integrase